MRGWVKGGWAQHATVGCGAQWSTGLAAPCFGATKNSSPVLRTNCASRRRPQARAETLAAAGSSKRPCSATALHPMPRHAPHGPRRVDERRDDGGELRVRQVDVVDGDDAEARAQLPRGLGLPGAAVHLLKADQRGAPVLVIRRLQVHAQPPRLELHRHVGAALLRHGRGVGRDSARRPWSTIAVRRRQPWAGQTGVAAARLIDETRLSPERQALGTALSMRVGAWHTATDAPSTPAACGVTTPPSRRRKGRTRGCTTRAANRPTTRANPAPEGVR